MAGFLVTIESGCTVEPWLDPPSAEKPSRLNPLHEVRHLRFVGKQYSPIIMNCLVPGLGDAPPEDGDLDSRLFVAWRAESPAVTFAIASLDRSSRKRWNPPLVGHYVIAIGRKNAGVVLTHFDITLP